MLKLLKRLAHRLWLLWPWRKRMWWEVGSSFRRGKDGWVCAGAFSPKGAKSFEDSLRNMGGNSKYDAVPGMD